MMSYDFFAAQKWGGIAFLIIVLGVLLTSISACKSPHRYLQKRNFVECETVGGYVAQPSKVYPKYELFRDKTSINDLLKYTNSKHIALKTYAYWALLEKMEGGYLAVFDKALYEKEVVSQRCGCTNSQVHIAHTAYYHYWEKQLDFTYTPDDEEIIFKGDINKFRQLDSLILHHPIQHKDLINMARNNAFYLENTSNK